MKAKDLIKELEKNPEAELFVLTEHMGMPYPRRLTETVSNGAVTLLSTEEDTELYLKDCE